MRERGDEGVMILTELAKVEEADIVEVCSFFSLSILNYSHVQTERGKRERQRRERREAEARGEGHVADASGAVSSWLSQRQMLDLQELSFENGSHLMSNKRCQLPDGSFRKQDKQYEEVHVPALKPRPMDDNEKLVDISSLPAYTRPAFEGFKTLNRIQSRLSKACLNDDGNLLLCAPTGAGKTNVAVLCILREIGKSLENHHRLKIANSPI